MLAVTSAPEGFAPSGWGRMDGWLLAYLFLPIPVFLLGFFTPWLGIPATAFALLAFARSSPFGSAVAPRWTGRMLAGALLLMAFAAAWTSLGGAGHLFHANSIDWVPRYGVLRDLVVYDWPPRYTDAVGNELILRAPLGYYLVPAVLGKLLGIAWADRVLLLWTWLGVSLFFLANFGGSPARRFLVLILFAIASGMDIAGVYWKDGMPWLGSHIEWWTGRMKYSSNSTMLYWIPNHVIPGWVLGAWLWRLQGSADFLRRVPVIGLAVMTWSPLPFVGALPMIAVIGWQFRGELMSGMHDLARAFAHILFPALLIAAYLLMGAGGIKAWAVVPPNTALVGGGFTWWTDTLVFIVIEVMAFGVLARQCDRSSVLDSGLLLLCLLPFFSFGPTNDLATLGAIPALTLMWLTLINELTSPYHQRRLSAGRRGLLVVLFLVGAVTPFQESYRALALKQWDPDPSMPAPVAIAGFPAHYYAPASHWFAAVLKETQPLAYAAMGWTNAVRR
ncbi:MAG: hypothetical protein Q7J42_00370 [Sulfuritalea sp.]|nr:hypothetical protein [Sulfuritalea sp.]